MKLKIVFTLLLAFGVMSSNASAQKDSSNAASNETSQQEAKEKRRQAQLEKQKKRNEYLMDFVRTNHPELEQLILKLKESKPGQYRAALQGLNKDVQKIDAFKEKNRPKYNLAVKQWVVESRLKVAKAQYRLQKSPENEQKLRRLIAEQFDFQIAKMKIESKTMRERADAMDKRRADFTAKRSKMIENRFRTAKRQAK